MAPLVFVDTGFFYARLSPHDQWHAKARRAKIKQFSAATSSLVVNETASLLQSRGFFSSALAFLREVRLDPELRIIPIDARLQDEAWELFGRYGGSGASITDCASFAVMRSLSIRRALTFDDHFRQAGFEILS